MIELEGIRAGQRVEYVPLPNSDVAALASKHLLLVGDNQVTVTMARAAAVAAAHVEEVELTADVGAIETVMSGCKRLDILFISASCTVTTGTLDTDSATWDSMFAQQVKAPARLKSGFV